MSCVRWSPRSSARRLPPSRLSGFLSFPKRVLKRSCAELYVLRRQAPTPATAPGRKTQKPFTSPPVDGDREAQSEKNAPTGR
jgi:hypothetical protein